MTAEPLALLHLDDAVVAVAKPSGLAVHRGWASERDVALTRARDLVGRRVFPVHRLDRGTSGVLLFALSSEIAARIQASFQAGLVEKTYLTLVRGIPEPSGTVDHPLRPAPEREPLPAVTTYRRLFVWRERYSLVEARPETGRLHQVRRHMKHLSCHVIGDVRYGKGVHNRFFRSEVGLARLALHALELRMPHPASGDELALRAPLPDDLAEPFRKMAIPEELWGGT